ncbi:MAG: hypothetical protein U9N61_05685 [Euryarchaeota archaeon]|nr:hypothetical protein [Euryarchaeota archaeon]
MNYEHTIEHQWTDEADMAEVVKVIRSDCVTTSPKIEEIIC